jgi:DNA-binding SARP family transcriptional activator
MLVAAAKASGELMARVSLRLLNAFALECDGALLQLPTSAQRVLAFVALHDHPLRRPYVAGSLWLDSPEDRAYANLRSALWRLRRCDPRLVEAEGCDLSLGCDVDVDLRDLERLARSVVAGTASDPLSVDASLFGSDLLPDWYDDWVLIEREHYRQLRLHALDALCERLTAGGRLEEALEVGLAAVAGEPLRESAQRALVRVHLAEGNVGEAARQYRLYRRLLHEQLGIEPSRLMEELVGALDRVETIR